MSTNSIVANVDEPDKVDLRWDSKNSEKQICQIQQAKEEVKCGFPGFYPRSLQWLASKKTFVVIYALAGLQQFTVSSYLIGTMSTLEKSFKMSSRMSGIITGAWDIGSLFANIAVTYVAAKGHRTRWIGFGMLLVSLTCFMKIIPYWLFGSGDLAKMYTAEYSSNGSDFKISPGNTTTLSKLGANVNCNVDNNSGDTISFYIFVSSQIIIGVGTAVYWTCGCTYLDDNVRKNIVPVMLAIVQFIRLFGPTVGFLLSSWALKIYVDPYSSPLINDEDPRWIGAWWLGWYPIGAIGFILAVSLFLFPRTLPRAAIRKQSVGQAEEHKSIISLSDFKNQMCRILKNKIVLFNSLSSVFFVLGLMGYWTFMPKYMESQFRLSASKSNFLTGTVGILCNALGTLTAGLFISKFKPPPRFLAGWNVFVEILDILGHASYYFMSCPEQTYHGHWNEDRSWNLTETCNVDLKCGTDIQLAPVCDVSTELAYYSWCHAGCTSTRLVNGTREYNNCSCVPGNGTVIDGLCPTDCFFNLFLFMFVSGLLAFTSSTGRSANTLIQFRCVNEEDKSLSIGVTETLLSLFAFFPAPILYGIIVDWTCIVWGDNCGEPGNCWLYDGHRLRYAFNFTATAFLVGGTILDCFVWYYAKGLKIYDEDFEQTNEQMKTKSPIVKNAVNGNEKDSIPLMQTGK